MYIVHTCILVVLNSIEIVQLHVHVANSITLAHPAICIGHTVFMVLTFSLC